MPPEPTLRTFIAIELEQDVRDALSRTQGKFKRGAPDGAVKWVNPDSIHLTLKFLGDTPVSKIGRVADALAAARDLSGSNLLRLEAAVERLVSPLGFPTEERGFSPHLTLGRIARNVSPATEAAVGQLVQDSVVEEIARQRVTAVSFIRSELRPAGPVYHTLATAVLGE